MSSSATGSRSTSDPFESGRRSAVQRPAKIGEFTQDLFEFLAYLGSERGLFLLFFFFFFLFLFLLLFQRPLSLAEPGH